MSEALISRAQARVETGSLDDALADVRSAYELAVEARDGELVSNAATWGESNVLDDLGRTHEELRALHRGLDDLRQLGVPRRGHAWLAALAAGHHLEHGDARECRDLLREALGSPTDGGLGSIQLRLTAALLAVRQGRTDEAVDHLTRAEKLVTANDTYRGLNFGITRVEVALAGRDPRGAYHVALGVLRGILDHRWERLPFLAARATGDLLQHARDRSNNRQVRHWLDALDDLERARSALPAPSDDFANASPGTMAAAFALYDAELARCRGDAQTAYAWRRAVDLCASVSQRWDEAYARWRLAEALVADPASKGRVRRRVTTSAGARVELGAEPWLREIDALAAMARIRLDDIRAETPMRRLPAPIDLLTPRNTRYSHTCGRVERMRRSPRSWSSATRP
jgi:tetratricopeptide (TPR) repeat protein